MASINRESNPSINRFHQLFGQQYPHSIVSEQLKHSLFVEKGLTVVVFRTDLIHPYVSGNKWFKLKYNLKAAIESGADRIISFGGAYSNHLHALAFACHALGIKSIGVIRGEVVKNPMLEDAARWGMELHFVDRVSYRQRTDPEWINNLLQRMGDGWLIPEGGSNHLAVKGVGELMQQIVVQQPDLNFLLCACGTGGTLAGLLSQHHGVQLEGVPVLKQGGFIRDEVERLLAESGCLFDDISDKPAQLDLHGHYGGYGKIKKDHLAIMAQLERELSIPLDPVYTAKLFRRFMEKVKGDDYPPSSVIGLLHTGGLQGARTNT